MTFYTDISNALLPRDHVTLYFTADVVALHALLPEGLYPPVEIAVTRRNWTKLVSSPSLFLLRRYEQWTRLNLGK